MNPDKLTLQDIKEMQQGTHTSQTQIRVAVPSGEKIEETHEIGDVWTDADGKTWEQKNGYRINIPKTNADGVGLFHQNGLFPNCQKDTCECTRPNRLDKKFGMKMGMCTNCVQEIEFQHQLDGTFDEYANKKMADNARAWLNEAKADKDAVIAELSKLQFENTVGKTEKWDTGINPEELKQKIEEEFSKFEKDFIQELENRSVTTTKGNTEEDIT